ncbi:AAA domain-containing protein [Candidatus Pacearchaeota archaeon]|nr:AAA domain-containing protein [Candidatus Pacearchaeota archaeon]
MAQRRDPLSRILGIPRPNDSGSRRNSKLHDLLNGANSSQPPVGDTPMAGAPVVGASTDDFAVVNTNTGISEANIIEETNEEFNKTPRDLFSDLTKYVIGQGQGLQQICNAVCYHYKGAEISGRKKSNTLLIGPTGSGKTYAVEKVSQLLDVPLLIADSTRFSGTGYVGDNVSSLIQELVIKAEGDSEKAARGIIYLDEIDKIAAAKGGGRDVAGRDVQNGLLKLIESAQIPVMTSSGPKVMDTKDILFIAGGAFSELYKSLDKNIIEEFAVEQSANYGQLLHDADSPGLIMALTKYGLVPEFLGRFPVLTKFNELSKNDLVKILTESEESILKSYVGDFQAYDLKINFDEKSIDAIAQKAYERGIGARGLKSVMEEALSPFKFYLPGAGINELYVTDKTILQPQDALLSLIHDNKLQGGKTNGTSKP